MGLRYGIKSLEALVSQAKPGKNVTQEQYDLMVSTLKMAKDMQKLRCGVLVISNAIILSILAGWVVKYGYDFDLGTKIQSYTVPINAVGLLVDWKLISKMKQTLNKANADIKKLRDINLSQMFR